MEFKVLKHGQVYVNMTLLYKGIYSTDTPSLLIYNTDMDKLKENWIEFSKTFGQNVNIVLENIDKCELVTVKLVEI
jgi:hypothetical protein